MPRPVAERAARRAAAAFVAAAVAGAALAACGPGATSTAQPTTAATTVAAATIPPLPSLGPGFSFVIPSFEPDLELEALLPDAIAGQPLRKSSMLGPRMIGSGPSGDDLRAVLEQFDKTPDDLSVAFGSAANVSISAYRIKGLDAGKSYLAFLALVDLEAVPAVTDVTISGKAVKKLVAATATAYVYTYEDVIFTIAPPPEGGPAADAVVADAISKLP